MGTWHNDNVGYYSQIKGLQDRLRKSEEERLKLEEKFNSISHTRQTEENARLNTFRENYSKILKEDRMRCDRNETIMQTLERIESRASMLTAKTDRLRLLRNHYEAYVTRLYPGWKKDRIESQNPDTKLLQQNSYLTSSPAAQTNSVHGLKLPMSSPVTHKSSLFPDTSRRISLAQPAIVLTEPLSEENLEQSRIFNPKSLFPQSNILDSTKLTNFTEFPPFRFESTSPILASEMIYKEPNLLNDTTRNSDQNRIVNIDRDQNTSGDLLSISLSDDNIKDIPNDTKPDCGIYLDKYKTNGSEHLAKAPSFGNRFTSEKKYTLSSGYSSPLSPKLKSHLNRTTSFDTLSKFEQKKNKYGYPSISRRQSLSSDNLDLRSDDVYKPRISNLDKTLNFGKYTSSIHFDDNDFKKYLVQPNQLDKKYEGKYKALSHIYLPGESLLKRKMSIDYTNPYGGNFDNELKNSQFPYKSLDDSLSVTDRDLLNVRPTYYEKERRYLPRREMGNDTVRSPYHYSTDLEDTMDHKYKTMTQEDKLLFNDKLYLNSGREFDERNSKNSLHFTNNPYRKTNKVIGNNHLNEEETEIKLEEAETRQSNNRIPMLSEEMGSLTNKLNQSIKSSLGTFDESNEKKNLYSFSDSNPNILSKPSEKKFIQSTGERTQSFPNTRNKIAKESYENDVDRIGKLQVKFELPPESERDERSELKEKFNLPNNLQDIDTTVIEKPFTALFSSENIDHVKPSLTDNVMDVKYFSDNFSNVKDKKSESSPKLEENVIITNDNNSVKEVEFSKPNHTSDPFSKDLSFVDKSVVDNKNFNISNIKVNLKLPKYEEVNEEIIIENDIVNTNIKAEQNNGSIKELDIKNPQSENLSKSSENKHVLGESDKEQIQGKQYIGVEAQQQNYEDSNKGSGKQEYNIDNLKHDNNNIYEAEIENIENQHTLKNPEDQKGYDKQFADETEQQYYEYKVEGNDKQEYSKPDDQQEHYYGGDKNIQDQQYYREGDQKFDDNKLYYEDNNYHPSDGNEGIKNSADQEYYEKNQHHYYDNEGNVGQSYYEGDPQYSANQQYYDDSQEQGKQYHKESAEMFDGTDQPQMYDENLKDNNDQYYDQTHSKEPVDFQISQPYQEGHQVYEGSVEQNIQYSNGNVPHNDQYYEQTENKDQGDLNNKPYQEEYNDQQVFNEGMEQNVKYSDENVTHNNQYYEQAQNKEQVDYHKPYQEGYNDEQVYEEGIEQNPQYSDENITNNEQYYKGNIQNVEQYGTGDGQETQEEQYYVDNTGMHDDTYHQSDETHTSEQYYQEKPDESQYYTEQHDQNYPQESYNNQQYYENYAGGQDYDQGQQYAEGGQDYDQKQQYAEGGQDYGQGQQYAEGQDYGQGQQYAEGQDYSHGQQYAEGGQDYSQGQQYAEGGPDYGEGQQYAEGDNYQYEYDKSYPEGYEHYPQGGNQYQEQYDPENVYNYPETGKEESETQDYNMEGHTTAARVAENLDYSPSQQERPEDTNIPAAADQEQFNGTFVEGNNVPQNVTSVSSNPAVSSDINQKQGKKQTSLSKVLDSDSDSVHVGAGQNVNDDSSDFDFSSEKK